MRRPAQIALLAAWPLVAAMTAGALAFAAPASADPDPGMPPCGGMLSAICNMVPTLPELDHDIDLTKNQPQSSLDQEHQLPADVCILSCI